MLARLLVALALTGTVAAGGWVLRRRASTGWMPAAEQVAGELRPGREEGWAVLAFTAPLCAACQRTPEIVARTLGVDEQALEAGQGPVAFHHLDVREHGRLVDHLGVTRTPTVVVLDPDGEVRFAEQGNPTPEALRQALGGAADRAPGRSRASTTGEDLREVPA